MGLDVSDEHWQKSRKNPRQLGQKIAVFSAVWCWM